MKTPHSAANQGSDQLYLALFHGRSRPDEKLSDWGFDGPIIGPVGIGWTYGGLRLFEPGWNDFEFLPTKDDLVHYDGNYFGDFEVFHSSDPKLAAAIRERSGELHDWTKFKAMAGVAV